MVMGRPTKYSDKTLEVANNYLHNYRSFGDEFPSRVGLALVLGVVTDTVYQWAKHPDRQDFSVMLDRIKMKQRQVLLNNGANGTFNSNIAKLVLAQHGIVSKNEHTGKDGESLFKGISVEFVDSARVNDE